VTSVDVIVAVYRGAEATIRCLESVLAAASDTAFELIVVNDASPEPELGAHLRALAERGALTLLEQPSRRGFAAAVNRALSLHGERDAVILHSDAEVADGWLDRLAHHATSERGVGTVAPFTNCGGAAGYPLTQARNVLPADHTVATLDALFREANAGQRVALPAVFGPCIYFRRECLAAVGAFDRAPLGSDYAVETDFCLRAAAAGFRHLLAGDVFVGHAGGLSYGAEADELARRSGLALAKLYPDYPALAAETAARDPARPFARRVDLLRLAASAQPLLLFISHPWGGGIRRHMGDLVTLAAGRCDVLYLEPAAGETVKLYWPRAGEAFAAYFTLPAELPALANTLRAIGIARLHFHHVHLLPQAILDLPSAVGVPYDCTLHDYFAICPQYHLVTEDGHYCGEPDRAGCTACLARRPGMWGLDIVEWRRAFGVLLRGADRLIAPSRDVARRIGRYFPDLAIAVWPHPEPKAPTVPRIVRVAVLGNLSPEKGLRVVAACATDAKMRSLPIVFRVIGSTTEPVPQSPAVPLTIHGQYDDAELASLLAAEKPDVVWFPAQVPETYSYTLSVALASGLPVVASSLGALPERLSGHPRSRTVPWNAPPSDWNAALVEAADVVASRHAPSGRAAVAPL
jgi:GT2 family glycosyltransferase/glycosyltransferase involved in cell wall biosynthesis